MTRAEIDAIRRIAFETRASERSVRRWWNGEDVSPATAYACESAAKRYKIDRAALIREREKEDGK